MAVRLNSNQLEMSAILTLCSGDEGAAAILLGNLLEDHFYMEATNDAFVRIRNLFKMEGKAPAFVPLSNDPALSEATRKFLKNGSDETLICRTIDAAKDTVDRLNVYRKIRSMADISKMIDNALDEDEVDIDQLVEAVEQKSTNLKVLGDAEDDIVRFGMGGDSGNEIVLDLLNGIESQFIPTGFPCYDNINYGLPVKQLVTIGGTSGGGKSALAIQLLKNITSFGYPGALVTLEMSKEECTSRLLSNCSGRVNPTKILAARMADGEKKQVAAEYKAWRDLLVEKESYYDIFAPSKSVTVEEVLLTLKPRGFKVVIIDYISLLEGTSGEDQWRKLGDVAWFGKQWAKANNACVIMLAQVNDDGKLKYSQTVKEHSAGCWLFTSDQKSREAGIIEIEQVKARNQRMFNFMLRTDLEHMRIFDESTAPVGHREEEAAESF